MGMFKSSSPGPDPELERQRQAEEARLAKEKAEQERLQKERDRIRRANLAGQKSLQSPEMEGFVGFRTPKMMGQKTKLPEIG